MQLSMTGPYGLPIVGHTCVFQKAHTLLPKPLQYRSGRALRHSTTPALDVAAKSQTEQQQANPGEPIESPTVNPIAKHQEGGKNDAEDQLYRGELTFREPTYAQRYWTSFRLFFALPWRRFKSESVLAIEISGSIGDKRTGRFGDAFSLPQVCEALIKAAYDPRIKGLYLKIGPVGAGWAKLKEVRDHLRLFRESGKFMIAFSTIAGEKEYFLASACSEIYMPPTGRLQLAGFSLSGTFLRGVLEKLGIDPEVRRIGTFKSAGDQLLRKDMSDSQREQLTAILEDVTLGFKQTIAEARGKSIEEVQALLDEGVFDNERYKEGGWVTDLWYEDQVLQALKERTGGKPDIIRGVPLRKYAWVSPRAFGFERGSKAIAVIRTSGIIVGGDGAPSDSVISASPFIKMLRQAAKTKAIAGVVLRVDSGGGDALASDLMWHEVQKLAEKKPVVASMGDVAGSGGYYLAMGAHSIVAQPLTITGSIGVVAATFKLQEVYRRAGYTKTVISRGRYAEQGNESRPFTDDESDLFDRATDFAYASFRDRAASSRGMSIEAMQEVAQGRVWTGRAAISRGLVDALGGVATAVELVKERVRLAAGDQDLKLRTVEVSRAKGSPLALLTGGGGALAQCQALLQIIWMAATQGSSIQQILFAAAQSGTQSPQLLEQLNLLQSRQPVALMPEIQIDGCGSSSIASSQSSLQSQGSLLLDEGIDELL